jgi:hypothetical protein
MSNQITSKLTIAIICLSGMLFLSANFLSSTRAPAGYTGAEGSTCTNCHGGNPLNATGGALTVSGLPETYIPGTTYTFSVTITHGSNNKNRWGFAMKAIGSNGNNSGSFSSANSNAGILTNSQEIGHVNAPFQSGSTYTFNNLRWTAPTSPLTTEQTIRFFAAGNAAGGTGNDFVYTTVRTITQQTSNVAENIPEIEKWVVFTASGTPTIQLTMKKSAAIQAALYTLSGQEVARLALQQLASGQHKIQLAPSNLATGTYIVTLISDSRKESKKLVVRQ